MRGHYSVGQRQTVVWSRQVFALFGFQIEANWAEMVLLPCSLWLDWEQRVFKKVHLASHLFLITAHPPPAHPSSAYNEREIVMYFFHCWAIPKYCGRTLKCSFNSKMMHRLWFIALLSIKTVSHWKEGDFAESKLASALARCESMLSPQYFD